MPAFLSLLFSNKYFGIGLVALISFILLGILGIFFPIFNLFIWAGVFFLLAFLIKPDVVPIIKTKKFSIGLRTIFAVTGLMIVALILLNQSISSLTASITTVASVGSVSGSPLSGFSDESVLPLNIIVGIIGATVGLASIAINVKQLNLIKKRRGRK